MRNHDASRRAMLIGAAAGIGAATGIGLRREAFGQNDGQGEAQRGAVPPSTHVHDAGLGAFFNEDQSATVAAIVERLMPGAPGKPGAREAGAFDYIDLALAGAYSDLQDFYRRGLASLEAHCRKVYNAPFVHLDPPRQDDVIKAMEDGNVSEFSWPSPQAFFNTLRTHTMEGMFADPIYGGNRDFAGWRLLGFPGAQALFTSSDLESTEAFSRLPIVGLRARG